MDWSSWARDYHRFLGFAGMDGTPDAATVQYLLQRGLSSIDAVFIAGFDGVNKDTLKGLLDTGMNPYDALSVLYGGHYMPNVDHPPLPNYWPPAYAPLAGYPKVQPTLPTTTVTPPTSTGTGTTTPPAAANLLGSIPSSLFGVPTIYLAGGAALLYLLMKE